MTTFKVYVFFAFIFWIIFSAALKRGKLSTDQKFAVVSALLSSIFWPAVILYVIVDLISDFIKSILERSRIEE